MVSAILALTLYLPDHTDITSILEVFNPIMNSPKKNKANRNRIESARWWVPVYPKWGVKPTMAFLDRKLVPDGSMWRKINLCKVASRIGQSYNVKRNVEHMLHPSTLSADRNGRYICIYIYIYIHTYTYIYIYYMYIYITHISLPAIGFG